MRQGLTEQRLRQIQLLMFWPSVIYPCICWAQAWVQLWSYSLTVTVTISIFEFWRPGFYRSWQQPTLAASSLRRSRSWKTYHREYQVNAAFENSNDLWVCSYFYTCIHPESNFRGNQFWRIPICFDLRLESSLSTAQLLHEHHNYIRASAPSSKTRCWLRALASSKCSCWLQLHGITDVSLMYPLAIRYNHGTSVAQPTGSSWVMHTSSTDSSRQWQINTLGRWKEGAWGDTFGVGHT